MNPEPVVGVADKRRSCACWGDFQLTALFRKGVSPSDFDTHQRPGSALKPIDAVPHQPNPFELRVPPEW